MNPIDYVIQHDKFSNMLENELEIGRVSLRVRVRVRQAALTRVSTLLKGLVKRLTILNEDPK